MLMATVTTPQKSSRKPKKEVNIVSPDSKANNAASPPSPISKSPIKDFSVERVKENVKEAGSTHVEVSREVKNVYKIIQRSTGATGGNGYNGAIYGELTAGSMQKIINYLAEFCHLNEDSCFIDVGAGLGKPNFHVLQYPKVKLSVGVELEEIRWKLSMNNLRYYLRAILKEKVKEKGSHDLHLNHHVSFICADIDSAHSLDPFTHVYMYDLGFPPDLQKSIATKFNNSIAPRYLISYRPPRRVIEEYGYEVELIHQMNTKMFGSGESHMAYFYQRNGRIPDVPVRPHQRRIVLPCSEGINDKKLDYSFSDELFIQAIERLKHEDGLYAYVEDIVERHLNCPRATRSSTCK